MIDKSTAHEPETTNADRPDPRRWIAVVLLWLDRPGSRKLVRGVGRALHRFFTKPEPLSGWILVLIVLALAFCLFQFGKILAYMPEVAAWLDANWPAGYRP